MLSCSEEKAESHGMCACWFTLVCVDLEVQGILRSRCKDFFFRFLWVLSLGLLGRRLARDKKESGLIRENLAKVNWICVHS